MTDLFNGKISDNLFLRIKATKLIAFDFDGVFTDNSVIVDQNGVESVRCWRSDGLGLSRLKKLDLKAIILSTEENPVVAVRSQKLQIECTHGSKNKLLDLKDIAKKSRLELNQIAYVGNDINDLECLKAVGFPIVVADAHPEVIDHCLYKTKTPGGYGAVREICDLFYQVSLTP